MSANLQKQIDTLETRTDSLENILGQFISSMNRTMIRTEADTEAFKTSVDKSVTRMEASVTRTEADTEAFRTSVDKSVIRMEADTETFKREVRADIRKLSRQMGDISNKMGTLVEDMVAPNIPEIAREFFGDDDLDLFAVRMMKRNTKNPGWRREFDIIAMTERNFYVNETKSNPKPEYVGKFIETLGEIGDYFPESRGKRIIPIFASLHIPEDTRTYLTRNRIYAMGMREDTMTLLNFGQLSEQGA